MAAQEEGSSRVFTVVDDAAPSRWALACHSLSAHIAERGQLTRRLGRSMPAQLPSVLLGRLARDISLHGEGLGEQILAEAAARVSRLCDEVGFRLVVIDALHERTAAFYEHFGLVRAPTDGSLRLVLR